METGLSDSYPTKNATVANNFRPFQAESTPEKSSDGAEPVVAPKLHSNRTQTYGQIRAGFKNDLKARDIRFSLSEHVAGQLSIEEDEALRFQKRVDEAVKERLLILTTEAEKKGHAEGLGKGQAEAYAEEKARLAQQLEKLALAIGSIEQAKAELGSQYEKSMVELSLKLAEVIAGAAISQQPELISQTILTILEKIAKEDDVRVWVPASAIDCIELIKKEVSVFSRSGRITFDINNSLAEGSCIVESLSGEIAANLKEKVQKLSEELRKKIEANHRNESAAG